MMSNKPPPPPPIGSHGRTATCIQKDKNHPLHKKNVKKSFPDTSFQDIINTPPQPPPLQHHGTYIHSILNDIVHIQHELSRPRQPTPTSPLDSSKIFCEAYSEEE